MSELRLNFLNWRPDAEEFGNDGLSIATNVIHDTEGYKQVRLTTALAVTTTAPFTASIFTDVRVARAGVINNAADTNKVSAYIRSTSPSLTVAGWPTATTTISFATAAASSVALKAFQITESNGNIFVVAHAEAKAAGGTTVSANFTGYLAV